MMNQPEQPLFLVSAHAYPDPAVGARRLSEFATFLASRGFNVHLYSLAGPFEKSGGTLPDTISHIQLANPQPISTRILGWLRKKKRRSENHHASGIPTEPAVAVSEAETHSRLRQVLAPLAFHYFRFTVAVDRYKRWSTQVASRLQRDIQRQRPSALMVSGPPFSILAATAYVSRRHQIPLVVDFRDPWLQDDNNSREYSGFRQIIDAQLESYSIRQASWVVTTSLRLRDKLRARYPKEAGKILMIRNGYEEGMLLSPPEFSGRLELLFAGTIYLNRNPIPLLEAIHALREEGVLEDGKFLFRLIGDCSKWMDVDLETWIRTRSLSKQVEILPPVPAKDVVELTRRSQVLVNFAQNQLDSVPAKLFEQIAANRQILLFAEAESESALACSDYGRVIRLESDVGEIKEALRKLYSQWVLGNAGQGDAKTSVEEYSRERTNLALLDLIRNFDHPKLDSSSSRPTSLT